jgi:hypothetical protein
MKKALKTPAIPQVNSCTNLKNNILFVVFGKRLKRLDQPQGVTGGLDGRTSGLPDPGRVGRPFTEVLISCFCA